MVEKNKTELARLRAIVDRLPRDAAGGPIVPGDRRWVVHAQVAGVPEDRLEEVVVESIGDDRTVHVGGLPGVNDDCWDELAEDLHPSREAAEASRSVGSRASGRLAAGLAPGFSKRGE